MNAQPLNRDNIATILQANRFGRPVQYYTVIASTNDELKKIAAHGTPAGAMVITDYQSAGKGRLGRSWEAPPNSSLLFSLLLRPDWGIDQLNWPMMIAGLAIADAIELVTGVAVRLKWPNDVVVCADDGTWRKVAGILLESLWHGDQLTSVVVGMGINVNISAEQMPVGMTPPTSLLVAGGQPVDRLALLAEVLTQMEKRLISAEAGHSPQPAWIKRLITIGQAVRVTGGTTTITGVAEACDEQGQLLVRDSDGMLHTIAAGDVTLRQS
ncbi:MAG: biotin--[acetyl-CoA-carboxylase] ligase [Anaerolineae bacterium]|nr:biotin--[acetyl-CoA-carboxylase] ligase [Anaerolineae bacterium]